MKKLFALITFVCCVSAQAATWVPVISVEGKKSAVDINSLIYSDNAMTIRSAWVKTFDAPKEYSITRVFIHCPTRMIASGYYSTFTTDGFLLVKNSTLSPWEYNVPNSMGEAWSNIICTTPANNR